MTVPSDSFLDLSSYFAQENFRAGFSLGSFPYTTPEDRKQLAEALGLNSSNLVVPKQVHGNQVQFCIAPGKLVDIDALISKSADVVLSIQVADCIPLFVQDKNSKIFGLVHAGWRGTTKGIVSKTINEFMKHNTNYEVITLSSPHCFLKLSAALAIITSLSRLFSKPSINKYPRKKFKIYCNFLHFKMT